jgi:uncharacterized protein
MDVLADPANLLQQALEQVGRPPGPVRTGPDPVNLPMVHHFCQALGDRNPAYLDEERAAASARGRLVAPPGMLQTWVMDAPRDPDAISPNDALLRLLDEAGYTSVVAVDYEHEYLRELGHGERIGVRTTSEDLSAEKATALGPGVFTTVRYEYLGDDGELVGVGRMRLLKFRPPAAGRAAGAAPGTSAEPTGEQSSPGHPAGRRAPAPVGRDNAFFWEGVEAGELRIQRCGGCGVLRHPPAPLCADCGSTEQGWVVGSGRGTVHSHVTHHHPPLPGVELPHVVLLVELEEGVRLISELAPGADRSVVRIGLPVAVSFEPVPGGDLRPVFRPAGAAS